MLTLSLIVGDWATFNPLPHSVPIWHRLTKLSISLCIPDLRGGYRDRRLTTNFELWVEILCVPTCFHMRIPKPCLYVCPYPEKRNHPSFVNVSPTLVIDTSMERPSQVLHHGNPKIWFFFLQKSSKFEFWLSTKSWNHHSFVNMLWRKCMPRHWVERNLILFQAIKSNGLPSK